LAASFVLGGGGNKATAERYATDAEYRASLIVTKYHDR
jgi:hypothetical protein